MFTVTVQSHFTASHQLCLSDGSKEPLHHHDWVAAATVGSENLDRMGLVLDFRRLSTMLDAVLAPMGNCNLATLDYFQRNNPSAENVAKYVYEQLCQRLPARLRLEKVRIIEEPGCWAEFSGSAG